MEGDLPPRLGKAGRSAHENLGCPLPVLSPLLSPQRVSDGSGLLSGS